MTEKSGLDALDINLDEGFESPSKTPEPIDPLGNIDLSLDDVDTVAAPVKDELQDELNKTPPKENLSNIDITLDDCKKPEEIIFVPDLLPPAPPKPEEVKVVTTVVDTTAGTETPVPEGTTASVNSSEGLDINLDIPVDQPPEPPKKERKPRTKRTPPPNPNPSKKQYSGTYDPVFQMSKIVTGKYNVRHTIRTEEEIADLASDIKTRGQLEPLHLVKEGEEYHLIAGYGRHEAMSKLGSSTARVIYYENLTQEDIFGIATGTNQKRTEFTAWDNIFSFMKFTEMHKDIPLYTTTDEASACSIFGIGKSMAYSYKDLYDFFKDKVEFVEMFRTVKIPYHVLVSIYDKRREIETAKAEAKIIELVRNLKETTRSQFKEILDYTFGASDNIQLDPPKSEEEVKIETEMSVSPEVDKITLGVIEKEASKIADDKDIEKIKVLEENRKYVNEKARSLIENFTFINQSILDILAKDGLSDLIDPDVVTSMKKHSKETASLLGKMFA